MRIAPPAVNHRSVAASYFIYLNSLSVHVKKLKKKHWDSAYVRQGTSYQCRDMDPDPDPNPYPDPRSGSPPKFNRLFSGPLPTFRENFMQIGSEVFAQIC